MTITIFWLIAFLAHFSEREREDKKKLVHQTDTQINFYLQVYPSAFFVADFVPREYC